MKKLVLATALLFLVGITSAQTIEKGNLIGLHVVKVELASGVTMDEYIDFMNDKYIPEFERIFKGFNLFVMKGIRGEHKGELGFLFHAKDEATRNQYNNDDGSPTELSKKLRVEIEPLWNKLEELGKWDSVYTDWIIQ